MIEDICKIANTYSITPKDVIKIYNRAGAKDYVTCDDKAIQLTERYIRIRYPLRHNGVKFSTKQFIEFYKA